MAAGEAAAAAAKMDALEADMARTEKKLARAAQKSHTYGSLLANGMMDKVLWLIDHPCEHTRYNCFLSCMSLACPFLLLLTS